MRLVQHRIRVKSTQMKFPADFSYGDAMFCGTGSLQQPLNRLFIWLIAQSERPVMHRGHEPRTRLIGHRKRLFRIAVCMNPGIVSPNGHDGQVNGPRGANLAEHIGISRVSAKKDAMTSGFDQISVISAM